MHEIPADFVRLPDPYPILDHIRESGRVQQARLNGTDLWFVTGYDQVVAGLTRPTIC